jgi:hypothetical protein
MMDSKPSRNDRFSRLAPGLTRFAVTGLIAAASLWSMNAVGLQAWVLFLAWTGYVLSGGSQKGVKLMASFAGGIVAGLSAVWLAANAFAALGSMALPAALLLIVGAIAALETSPPLDFAPAWFLGMVAYFGAGAVPDGTAIPALVLPAAAGIMAGWLEAKLRSLVSEGLRRELRNEL